jgi:hypothetical protein
MKFLIKKYISYLRKISNKNLPSKNTFSLLKRIQKGFLPIKKTLKRISISKKTSLLFKKKDLYQNSLSKKISPVKNLLTK